MQLMLLGVQLDAGGADGQQALGVLAEVGDELVGVVRAFLLGVLEGADVVIAGLGSAVAAWVISVSAHYISKLVKRPSDLVLAGFVPQPHWLGREDLIVLLLALGLRPSAFL